MDPSNKLPDALILHVESFNRINMFGYFNTICLDSSIQYVCMLQYNMFGFFNTIFLYASIQYVWILQYYMLKALIE